jgi:uncharacterized tellurite resistance protein B-like protein
METQEFEKLLIKSAFSCMVCDGEIDKNEINLIKSLFSSSSFQSTTCIDDLLNQFITEINSQGNDFLRLFLKELKIAVLTEEEELKLIDFCLKTIYSDFEVKYNEIKFFKIIRSKLKVSNERILEKFPSKDVFLEKTFEIIKEKLPSIEQFLEEDIVTETYIERLKDNFFSSSTLPQFETIKTFDNGFLDSVKE